MRGVRLLSIEKNGETDEPKVYYFRVEGWPHPIAVSVLEAQYARVLDEIFFPEAGLEQRAEELARIKVDIYQREIMRNA